MSAASSVASGPGGDPPAKSWGPTRKWWAATVIGVAGLVTLWIQKGHWDSEVSVALVALLSQRIVSYLVPNQDTPGGVPLKKAGG
jgi:hypothetical protein